MSTLYGDQYNSAYVAKPASAYQPNDFNGRVQRQYFEYTITAAPTAADVIKVAKVPKGARVYEAVLQFPDLGTTGTLELGFSADSGAVETADNDAFLVSVDVNTAKDQVGMIEQMKAGGSNAGYLKNFSAECDVEIYVTTAWTVTSGTIKGYIEFVM